MKNIFLAIDEYLLKPNQDNVMQMEALLERLVEEARPEDDDPMAWQSNIQDSLKTMATRMPASTEFNPFSSRLVEENGIFILRLTEDEQELFQTLKSKISPENTSALRGLDYVERFIEPVNVGVCDKLEALVRDEVTNIRLKVDELKAKLERTPGDTDLEMGIVIYSGIYEQLIRVRDSSSSLNGEQLRKAAMQDLIEYNRDVLSRTGEDNRLRGKLITEDLLSELKHLGEAPRKVKSAPPASIFTPGRIALLTVVALAVAALIVFFPPLGLAGVMAGLAQTSAFALLGTAALPTITGLFAAGAAAAVFVAGGLVNLLTGGARKKSVETVHLKRELEAVEPGDHVSLVSDGMSDDSDSFAYSDIDEDFDSDFTTDEDEDFPEPPPVPDDWEKTKRTLNPVTFFGEKKTPGTSPVPDSDFEDDDQLKPR